MIPKTKKPRGWCIDGGKRVYSNCWSKKFPPRNRYVRCKECGQRFEVELRPNDCCRGQDRYLPNHKATGSPYRTLVELKEAQHRESERIAKR